MPIHTLDLQFLDLEHAVASYLVETGAGPVLIESGPHSTYTQLVSAVEKVGYSIDEIKHVFLTHIHLDHAGAAWQLAQNGAQIYVHPIGVRHLVDPSKLMASARMIYKDDMDRLWGEMRPIEETKITAVGDNEVIKIDETEFLSLHTPGHAKHHIAWQVKDVIFTGDVAGVKIGQGLVQPPCPPPDINLEYWLSSIERLRNAKASTLFLTHYDRITNIDEHLTELESTLTSWAGFVRSKWNEGLTNDEIIPLFIDYTNKQLEANSLNQLAIDQYQAANPSWMSVAGLVRYWSKKLNHEKPI